MLLNTTIEFRISPEEVKIDPKVIATLMGIEGPIPEPYDEIIEKEVAEVARYEDISGGYTIIDDIMIDIENNFFLASGIQFNPGKQVIMPLKDAEKLAFFICTAGEQVSIRSKELMNSGFMLEGYVADLVGSVLAEEAMNIIHKEMAESLDIQYVKTTNRYSPGYCDWKVNEQHQLFTLFPENFCGVRLNESALMHPVKSISGVIGLGHNVKFYKYVCNACSSVNCIYRNLKYRV